jgi:nucleotide-binding universal stress UspA family protein
MSILVCYDGSQNAKEALSVAQATLSRGSMILLHVWNPPAAFLADSFSDPSTAADPPIAKLEHLAFERAQAIAAEGRELADARDLAVTVRIERNDSSVWQTILDVAADADAELIVVGTRGRTAVQSALLGSVSGAIVHHSQRPVLIVPAPARGDVSVAGRDGDREPVLR